MLANVSKVLTTNTSELCSNLSLICYGKISLKPTDLLHTSSAQIF